MKKYRLLYFEGWYFLPEEFIQAWSICDSKEDIYEAFRITLSEMSNTVFYIPGEQETIDSLFDLDKIKAEHKQVMDVLTEAQDKISGYSLRKWLAEHLIARMEEYQNVRTLIEDAKTLYKFITDDNAQTT